MAVTKEGEMLQWKRESEAYVAECKSGRFEIIGTNTERSDAIWFVYFTVKLDGKPIFITRLLDDAKQLAYVHHKGLEAIEQQRG